VLTRIGLLGNLGKRDLAAAVERALHELRAHHLAALVATPLVEALGLAVAGVSEEELAAEADAVISFGGDGTFLRAARLVASHGTPLLGVNLGSLGFLAEVRQEELPRAIASLAKGEFRLEKRRKIKVEIVRDENVVFEATALNDVVLNMGPVPRAIDLQVEVGATPVGRYLADGFILATPTGSTAYSLAAGGPIVDPTLDAFVLTPICPHSLGVRPMILEGGRTIEVHVQEGDSPVLIADGQVHTLVRQGDRLRFARAQQVAHFIRLPRRDFFQIIQEKLNWGGPRRSLNNGTGELSAPRGQNQRDDEGDEGDHAA
jgi:NAD+ kinase